MRFMTSILHLIEFKQPVTSTKGQRHCERNLSAASVHRPQLRLYLYDSAIHAVHVHSLQILDNAGAGGRGHYPASQRGRNKSDTRTRS